jgi:hypothetical protein
MSFPNSIHKVDLCGNVVSRAGRAVLLVSGVIGILLICLPLRAQINTGRISGAIADQTGGAISNAKVTVTEVATGVSRSLTTDSAGQYAAPNLEPGIYTVHVEFTGFQSV